VRTGRCTWRLRSSEFGDALGGHDSANLDAVIGRGWRCTWGPQSSELRDASGGHDRARLKEYLEEVDRRRTGFCDSIHQLVNSQLWECDEVTLPLSSYRELADGGQS
jgi:hypothetical protein